MCPGLLPPFWEPACQGGYSHDLWGGVGIMSENERAGQDSVPQDWERGVGVKSANEGLESRVDQTPQVSKRQRGRP